MKSTQLTKGMLLKDNRLQKQNERNNKRCYGYNHTLISCSGF